MSRELSSRLCFFQICSGKDDSPLFPTALTEEFPLRHAARVQLTDPAIAGRLLDEQENFLRAENVGSGKLPLGVNRRDYPLVEAVLLSVLHPIQMCIRDSGTSIHSTKKCKTLPVQRNWEGFTPVSYTHLDVYKRQT